MEAGQVSLPELRARPAGEDMNVSGVKAPTVTAGPAEGAAGTRGCGDASGSRAETLVHQESRQGLEGAVPGRGRATGTQCDQSLRDQGAVAGSEVRETCTVGTSWRPGPHVSHGGKKKGGLGASNRLR